jgi:hypothetical protein
MSESTTFARAAVQAIIARDGLRLLGPDDVERLVALYGQVPTELAQLRGPDVAAAEPAVVFRAE